MDVAVQDISKTRDGRAGRCALRIRVGHRSLSMRHRRGHVDSASSGHGRRLNLPLSAAEHIYLSPRSR